MALRRIDDLETLYAYLYAALQLEHATLPPYLTALYSIHPGTNTDALHVLRVVAVEEMLHMTLVANIMNAVGLLPNLTIPGFLPPYPAYLPDGETDFAVNLQKFSPEAIDTFLKIERPAKADTNVVARAPRANQLLPAYEHEDGGDMHFYSIGEFYNELSRGLTELSEKMKSEGKELFIGSLKNQVQPEYYYSGGGEVVVVTDLASAQDAIRLISEQGEGDGGSIYDNDEEISHYYRFEQLYLGRYYEKGDMPGHPRGERVDVDWNAVYPIKTNARISDFPSDSPIYAAALDFNRYYSEFLSLLTKAFSGQPELLVQAVDNMFRIREKATQLMRNPIPGMDGLHAAPTFEVNISAEV